MCGPEGNDSGDQRIYAAHQFIDSLRSLNPRSEIGIIRFEGLMHFTQGVTMLTPVPLINDTVVAAIHAMVDSAACHKPYAGYPKMLKTQATYTGAAVTKALQLADTGYSSIKDSLNRQIIILTDGEWADSSFISAAQIIDAYRTKFPGRPVPQIHGVFLSRNGDTTVLHTDLRAISEGLTGGLYFPGATGATIAARLIDILNTTKIVYSEQLKTVTVMNRTNGDSAVASYSYLSTGRNRFSARGKPVGIDTGINTIELRVGISMNTSTEQNSSDTVLTDTIIITRTADSSVAQNGYSLICATDTIVGIRNRTSPLSFPPIMNVTGSVASMINTTPVPLHFALLGLNGAILFTNDISPGSAYSVNLKDIGLHKGVFTLRLTRAGTTISSSRFLLQ